MSKGDLRRVSVDQSRLQGWLTVANAIETESLDQVEWQRRYCVLAKEERKLFFFNDTESVLSLASPLSPARFQFADDLDGQCVSSQRKNALTLLDPNFSNFQRGTRATRSFRDKVKSSIQKSVKRNSKEERLSGGSVRVGRSKSFGKVDRLDLPSSLPSRKLGASLDNLHRVGSSGTPDTHYVNLGEHGTFLDLTSRNPLNIQIVHQSVSPKHSCFRIITETDILYASCGSQEELNKWFTNLNDCQRPNRNHVRRLDTHLSLWLLEARNLIPKKRYYCEIFLNGVLYAQTCCKIMNDILFWGEPFVFEDLPPLGAVIIKLYRENYNKKKRERTPATELGKIEVPALVLDGGQLMEKWYPVTMYPNPKGSSSTGKDKERENVSIRIKLQYQVVSILPLKVYEDFLRFLKMDYGVICEVLEPVVSAKAKDEIAQTLVRILQAGGNGKAKEFLCDIIMAEVQHTENVNLIFRGNTFATKAVDTYMKMVGETYLRESLSGFVCALLDTYVEEDCEVDPMKLQPGANLQHNQQMLITLCNRAWVDILSSFNKFPSDLKRTLHAIRLRFGPEREDACVKLISGSIFLRFFCPAILSPSLFHLCQEYPDERTARKLTLVAKVIMTLANFTRFGVKEEYMYFMNDFVEREVKSMKQFIDRISSPVSDTVPDVGWGPCDIDIGREASIMHTILTTQLKTVQLNDASQRRLGSLLTILDQITKAGEEEEGDPFSSTFEALRVMQSTISKFNSHSGAENHPNSDSSSEYTTPAQSQSNSPTRETSPPPQNSHMAINSLLALSINSQLSPEQPPPINPSPSTSPTHSSGISSLATHSIVATRRSNQDPKISPPHHGAPERPGSSRRSSEPELHKLGVRPVPRSVTQPLHGHSRHDDAPFKFDENIEIAKLRGENAHLMAEIVRLRDEFDRQRREMEKENERSRREAARAEQELKSLRDSRGKVLRGLNTQTEIALVQFKRDFDHLKRQLQAKDDVIGVQERKIASLVEANCTLRSGLESLQSLPKQDDSDSDIEDEVQEHLRSLQNIPNGGRPMSNGMHTSQSLSTDLMKVITQLDSGKFDN